MPHITDTVWYLSFSFWLISLSMIIFEFTGICYKWHYFILFYCRVIFHCVDIPHLLYPFISGWTRSCFHVVTTVNNAAMNTEVHVSFQIRIFSRYMPRSGTAGSYGNLQEHILRVEKEMATHSSVLAWRIPWTGAWRATVHGVPRVGYNLTTKERRDSYSKYIINIYTTFFF